MTTTAQPPTTSARPTSQSHRPSLGPYQVRHRFIARENRALAALLPGRCGPPAGAARIGADGRGFGSAAWPWRIRDSRGWPRYQSPPKEAPTGLPEARSSCREGASGRVCRKWRVAGGGAAREMPRNSGGWPRGCCVRHRHRLPQHRVQAHPYPLQRQRKSARHEDCILVRSGRDFGVFGFAVVTSP